MEINFAEKRLFIQSTKPLSVKGIDGHNAMHLNMIGSTLVLERFRLFSDVSHGDLIFENKFLLLVVS